MRKKYKIIGLIFFLVCLVFYCLFSYINTGKEELIKNDETEMYEEVKSVDASSEEKKNQIVVEIKGAIKNPNVYWIDEESIVEDLINKAGGLNENADINSINRAEKLKNHQLIIIPDNSNHENTNVNVNILRSNKDNLSSNLININTADEKELDSLPGVGPSKAKDIIRYREEKGEFKSIEDIKNVKGIGESSFEKLKDKITV